MTNAPWPPPGLIRSISWTPDSGADPTPLVDREWIVANGLGGYASGTVAGVCTRRYHGLLIAALPSPLGRLNMLSRLSERVRLRDGTSARLGGDEVGGSLDVPGAMSLVEFRSEAGLPVWKYRVGSAEIEKRIDLPHGQNTAHVTYRLVSGDSPARMRLQPSLNVRNHDAPVDTPLGGPYTLRLQGDRYEVDPGDGLPVLKLYLRGGQSSLVTAGGTIKDLFYRVEAARGYPEHGSLWSPGYFRVTLRPDSPVTLTVSIEPWPTILAMEPAEAFAAESERRRRLVENADPGARSGFPAELVLAADAFVITPAGRVEDEARAHASGDEVRTVIAGYHWFTDWGRDTMISLEGLTLCTGRRREAGYLLRTFAHYVRDGLIPNLFPEGKSQGLYHTADATLWFFHALSRYLQSSGDRETLRLLLPTLLSIFDHHMRGTRFGIHVDPSDGLLHQGAEGYQLTWMDAKVGDWVVTPRRGKAVEINALWYNALRLLEIWVRESDGEASASPIREAADRCRESFNRRFWNPSTGFLFDVIDGSSGDDPACRPNQVFAVSLDHPVLDSVRWLSVLDVVRDRLLTPVGLRSLSPGHPDYKPTYDGDLRSRDASYHQGTVWAWLIGAYIDAHLRVNPDDLIGARRLLEGFAPALFAFGVGTLGEIFDAEPPYTPRGCIAQAWSVAEVLRAWIRTDGRG